MRTAPLKDKVQAILADEIGRIAVLRIRKAKMIHSAEEFIALRDSDNKEEYDRSAFEEAPLAVWRDLIQRYPDYRRWVAHNKTVPVEILAELCNYGPDIRQFVATKRRLSRELFILLSQDPAATVRQSIAVNKRRRWISCSLWPRMRTRISPTRQPVMQANELEAPSDCGPRQAA